MKEKLVTSETAKLAEEKGLIGKQRIIMIEEIIINPGIL